MRANRLWVLGAFLVAAVTSTGCENQTRTITEVQTDTVEIVVTDTVRVGDRSLEFNQIERLGNPLVNEAMIEKRRHSLHNGVNPSRDVELFRDEIFGFVKQFGRSDEVANTIATVLLPDMLIVQTQRSEDTAGWLTWALADGYGGRTPGEDVVDAALMAIFGDLLTVADVPGADQDTIPGLTTDNVPAATQAPMNAFPYLAPPN